MPRKIALMIGAHPDDCEIAAGGTALSRRAAGWEVHFLVATDGSKGTPHPHHTSSELVALRRREQEAACAAVGVASLSWLGGVDGELQASRALLGQVVGHLRRLRPQAVFTHSPESLEYTGFMHRRRGARINHSDHRVLAQLVLDAVYPAARDRLSFPELGLPTHHVRWVYLWGARRPNRRVDVTGYLSGKLEALGLHQSQFGQRDLAGLPWKNDQGRCYERFFRIGPL